MNKLKLLNKIKLLDGLSNDEKAELINLVKGTKKYGLVWEDKPEEVEELLRENLPVLKEVKDKEIVNGDNYPNHILIEGDNLHALTALTFTHEGKINVIYIDPPYNTGNKDFKYNDTFVDREDGYRHTKWLSFVSKRLELAKSLLRDDGVIFISIDDNEIAQLKILCDEIFGETSFVGEIIWKNVTDNNPTNIAHEHEYILCFAKNISILNPVWKSTRSYAKETLLKIEQTLLEKHNNIEFLEKEYKSWFKENKQYLGELDRYKYIDFDGVFTGSQSVHNPGREGYRYDVLHPITNKPCKEPLMGYRFPKSTMEKLIEQGRLLYGEDHNKIVELKVYAKDYQSKLSSLIELDGRLGANELRTMFYDKSKIFNNPKPVDLLTHILSFSAPSTSIVLDFFAGSGTTLHATMQLNAEDGGNRQCILVTNNENNICEEVTYERNKRVIRSYTNAKGERVDGLENNNLRYYQTHFIPSEKTETNRRKLTAACTELLQIKEDCYQAIKVQNLKSTQAKVFTNNAGKYMVVVYYSRQQQQAVEILCNWVVTLKDATEKIKVYAFSPEAEIITADFADVADKIDAVPLPEAIYNSYRNTFRTLRLDQTQKEQQKAPVKTEVPASVPVEELFQ